MFHITFIIHARRNPSLDFMCHRFLIYDPQTKTISKVICQLAIPSSTTLFWPTRAMATTMGTGYSSPPSRESTPSIFRCVIEGPETQWTSLEITRNGNALGSTFEEGTRSGSGYHCGSTSVISDVTVGVHIFIRTQETTRVPKLQWIIWKNLIFWLVFVLKEIQ